MTSHQELFNFVFEKLDDAPAAKRIRILRALADFAGGDKGICTMSDHYFRKHAQPAA